MKYLYHQKHIIAVSLLIGMFFCAFYSGMLVIRSPFYTQQEKELLQKKEAVKKNIQLCFWHNNRWQQETISILWHNTHEQNLYHIITNWLNWAQEENVLQKKVALQTVLLSASGNEAFLSFDQVPFDEQDATHTQWMFVESLLKTLRDNNITIAHIRFLVHHQPLEDDHLDFTNAWPLNGFLSINT